MGPNKQQWKGDGEGRRKDMHEKTMLKRWWWRETSDTMCTSNFDYGSNNMVLWEICNDLRSNSKLINKMLCIDFLRTSCMMSPYEKPWW